MVTKKFRAFDPKTNSYRTFYLADLLKVATGFEGINPDDVALIVGIDSRSGDELYEGDIDFFRFGEPLSVELSPVFCDKYGHEYFTSDLIKEP